MIMPYISFTGQCEEAFTWYAEIFNGKIEHLVKYRDMPEGAMNVEENQKNLVMHAEVMLTATGGISGADAIWEVSTGGNIAIHVHLDNTEKANNIFEALSNGGVIVSPLATNPPPDDHGVSGSVTDKYGITWIVSALK